MKIGFDISQTGRSKAGCGYFADSLIKELAKIDQKNEYLLYKTFGDSFWDSHANETAKIEQANFKQGLKHHSLNAAQEFWRNSPADMKIQLGSPDIIHANNFFCPTKKVSKVIYTLYDLSFLEHPELTTEMNRTICFNGLFTASLNADFIVAISEYSRCHFLKTFPHYPAEQISVVYPASRFSNKKYDRPVRVSHLQPNHFWLNVGTLEPRKNHRRLLQAYAKLKAHQGDMMPLVLAGGDGWMMSDFQNQLTELGLQQDVICLGYVDDIELQWLYQNCFSFIYPSLFEGFGLPVLEAMSSGAAVVTSDISSIPEIVGAAGVLINPFEVESIFQAMRKLHNGEVNHSLLKNSAIERSKIFSWQHTAKRVLETYQMLAPE